MKPRLPFHDRYVTVPEAGCWLFLYTAPTGYGRYRDHKETIWAHRYSLEMKLGRPIAAGMCACHKCDTKCCVNPDHLYEGSHADNMADKVLRGKQAKGDLINRAKRLKGSQVPWAKLTEDDVRHIRSCSDKAAELARRYGVSPGVISCVRKGKTWRSVK
jgi:hypothetical protein